MDEIQELVSRGKILLEDGKFDDALGFFEQALLLNQDDPDLWNYKGITLRSLGRYEEAMDCFNKSLNIDPRDRNAS
ncbi:tetratricopeptide repeat protein [Candidatus Nitrosopumilus sp. SW]|uniref:tetratricopeptide repeat protein n=1 Tax=Candidatus Nitrosopumilus sp. SW TaxID=2508726 RepID=UPI0011541D10|nr:tetratricopeptide repeat protein [Candidatus Nitrosopumilus sp. SW]QDI88228.1 tetratricopeptide repeat protein [Candidatus Nitrosopumilus sp. SW]